MKLPVPAPTLGELFQTLSGDLGTVVLQGVGPEVEGQYLHWDKLRHLIPPNALSAKQWWLGIKLARSVISRGLEPLFDKHQLPFTLALTDSMHRRLHYVDREAAGSIAGLNGTEEGQQNRYLVRSLMEEAMTSSQLEGASTTRAVAKEMLKTGRKPRDQSERMIYNNYQVMREVKNRGHRPFTPGDIIELHRMLTTGTLDSEDDCGQLRTAADNVVIYDRANPSLVLHVPPKADELPERLQRLCDFANEGGDSRFLHPVVKAIALHFQLAYDHPFCDGNGRTARILFYWSMLNSGYWLVEYLSISSVLRKAPSAYIQAYLYTESDERDLSYFVAQQLEAVERAIHGLHDYLARKAQENRRAEALLKSPYVLGRNLNHRQRALLAHAIRAQDRSYTVASHQASHRVTYPTALNDLNDLVAAGLLSRERIGKANYFFPVSDLAERLTTSASGHPSKL